MTDTLPATPPAAPVNVHKWGEAAAEKKIANAVRVFIAGQHAGAVALENGAWVASRPRPNRGWKPITTQHGTAEDALKAVLRSGFARKLGARANSNVHVTGRAARVLGRPR